MKMKPMIALGILALGTTISFGQADTTKAATPNSASKTPATPTISTGASFRTNPAIRTNVVTSTNLNPQLIPSRPGFPVRPPGMAESISPEQRNKLMDANNSMQKDTQPLYLQMRQVRMELDQLVSTNNIDESAIRAKASELGKIEGDLAVIRARHQKTIRGFLSTNQAGAFQPAAGTNLPAKRLNAVVERLQTPPQPSKTGPGTPPQTPAIKK